MINGTVIFFVRLYSILYSHYDHMIIKRKKEAAA